MGFCDDTLRYLYLPRLSDKEGLPPVVKAGAASPDVFASAHRDSDAIFEGFGLGVASVQFTGTLLLIEPGATAVSGPLLAEAAAASFPKPLPRT